MYAFHGIFYLLWHAVMFPVHLVITIVKFLIVAPILLLVALLVAIFACVGLLSPNVLHQIPVPVLLNGLTTQVQNVVAPEAIPSKVTCDVQGQVVVITWAGPSSDLVTWYQVLRRPITDSTWNRIAIVPSSSVGQYVYGDATGQHGLTYQYGVVAIKPDGTESDVVISPVQVVAP